jgi:hypothetical protein
VSRFSEGRRDREWLCQIVVAAGTQAAHPVIDGPKRAEHQDRLTDVLLPCHFDDRETVNPGQEPIHDHDVRVTGAGLIQAFDSCCRPIDFKTAIDQLGYNLARRFGVIFDQQHSGHQRSLVAVRVRLYLAARISFVPIRRFRRACRRRYYSEHHIISTLRFVPASYLRRQCGGCY